jgi:hypothetical protein
MRAAVLPERLPVGSPRQVAALLASRAVARRQRAEVRMTLEVADSWPRAGVGREGLSQRREARAPVVP